MKTLYFKFTVVTIGIMFISFIIAFLISNIYYQQKLKPSTDQKNTKIALDLATFTKEHPTISLDEYLESVSAVGYQMLLVDQNGRKTYFGDPFRDKNLPESTIENVLDGHIFHGILHFPQNIFITGFFADELNNTIGAPLKHNGSTYALFIRPDIEMLFNEMHILFGLILALSIALSIAMVLISTKYLVNPISKLTKATKLLSKGNFNVVIDSKRHDELGVLSKSFLEMAKKLEQVEEMRKEFISNISHDIQSPLSNIKGYVNLLENETLNQEQKKQFIAIINDETKRLSNLTKQLLLLASLDRNENIIKKKPFNVGQQIRELVRNYQWVISEKGLMLSYTLPDTEINGDPSLLNTVWDNLLSNTIKYNKPNGSIEISIEKKEEIIVIVFKDTGIGMNPTEIERIFDRFYRADISRTRTVEGTGLGLSIAVTIVKLHDGDITVSSEENEGTIFKIELPINLC